MTPAEFAASLRRHIEHASAGLPDVPEERRAAFWRIVEWQAEQLVSYVLSEERERCAGVAQSMAEETPRAYDEMRMMAFDIAAAIRALE